MPVQNATYILSAIKSAIALSTVVFSYAISANTQTQPASKTEKIPIVVNNNLLEQYRQAINGRKLLDITDYSSKRPGRQYAEVLLFEQALLLGGYDRPIKLIERGKLEYNDYINEIAQGHFAAIGNSAWCESGRKRDSNIHTSSPIIQQGEFRVGIYTRTDNQALLNLNQLHQLRGFSAVSNSEWSADWRTLSALPLKALYDTTSWMPQLKMLITRRADFMLLPIQNTDDLSINYSPSSMSYIHDLDKEGGIRLIPVPNVKIQIHGERCYLVSRQHPEGEALFLALQKGLKQLRSEGRIRKALTDAKFFHPATTGWTTLNPSPNSSTLVN